MTLLRSGQHQDSLHELIIVDLYPTIVVRVEIGKRFGYLLHYYARAHEAIERDALLLLLTPWVATLHLRHRCFHIFNK